MYDSVNLPFCMLPCTPAPQHPAPTHALSAGTEVVIVGLIGQGHAKAIPGRGARALAGIAVTCVTDVHTLQGALGEGTGGTHAGRAHPHHAERAHPHHAERAHPHQGGLDPL